MSAGGIDPKLIGSLPPSLLKTLPAASPPEGIQPNFAHPSTQVPAILGVTTAFVVLAVLCFSIRIYTKLAITKNWKWDDLTCSLGFSCGIIYFVVVINGSINGSTGKHLWDLYLDKPLNESTLYQDYLTTIVATPALGLIKCSLFIQYYLLFSPLRWVRISVWIGVTISALFYSIVTITAFILNSPWPGESLLEDILSWHYLKFAQFSIPTGVIGVLVDWYLLILPIPAVLTLHMSTTKKLGILVVFMTGGLAAIASIVTLYYRIQLQENFTDSTWKSGYVSIWVQIEMFAGVTASSMPTIHQFFTRPNFSLKHLNLSLKTGITHVLSSPSRARIPSKNSGFTGLGESNTYTSEFHGGFRMNDLESHGCERKFINAPLIEDSQIHLTRDVSVTQEQIDVAAIRPTATGRYHQ